MTRFIAAVAVLAVAVAGAVISYSHVEQLALSTGQSLLAARLLPVSIDGLVLAASMVLLDSARGALPAPALARVLLGLGVAATLAANAAAGAPHGVAGIAVSMWPAVAFIGSAEAFLMLVRGAQEAQGSLNDQALLDSSPAPQGVSSEAPASTPAARTRPARALPAKSSRALGMSPAPAEVFRAELEAGTLPSIRTLKRELRVGQDRAVEIRDQLAARMSGPAVTIS